MWNDGPLDPEIHQERNHQPQEQQDVHGDKLPVTLKPHAMSQASEECQKHR